MIPYSPRAHRLFLDGAVALAEVESNGLRVDVAYLERVTVEVKEKIAALEQKLQKSEVAKVWKKTFGNKMNFGSGQQLSKVLFDVMGFESSATTASGKFKTDERALASINDPFVQGYLEIKKLTKVHGTYLKGLRREVVDGYIHPFFNLHTARTFRSSSDSPNFQNIPIRNPEFGSLVRKAFIAREGHRLVEVDYSGIEVRIAACYHKDPAMISYINDPSKDMHRDSAEECFLLDHSEMIDPVDSADKARIKMIRYCGKNMFVFPQFYGDWYLDCAREMWAAMADLHLTTRDGTPLKEHLRQQGIEELGDLDPRERPRPGTFEHHIKKVEDKFWNKRFPVYAEWKKKWVDAYLKKNFMLTKTGFICQGIMKKNEIINYPVQGSAFHCLLQSLVTLVKGGLRGQNLKALIVGQVHDSIVADVPDDELDDFLVYINWVMTVYLAELWPWINVPLEIEAEVSPLGGSWADKKQTPIPGGM